MERLSISKYNDKIKKIKIDEIETTKLDDSFTNKIYKIAMDNLENAPENFMEEEIDENIQFNKCPIDLLSLSINSNSLSATNSLRKSNISSQSDKTAASSSEFQNIYNDNNNILVESYNENNEICKKIDIINIITGEDKRTMIEINKIPKKYDIKSFKEELNNKGLKGKYDYISFETIDRYNNDINNLINHCYKKAYINFIEPLHIIIFYYLFQKKYFNFKGNKNEIQYSDHLPKRNFCLDSKDILIKNNNYKKKSNLINKIEIPKEYLDFYKKVNPNDVCINSKENYFGIDTFIVKKNH